MPRQAKRDNDPRIGRRLREARLRAGLSTRDAAGAIGMRSHSIILQYESGEVRVPWPVLTNLARAYHIKLSDLSKPPGAPWSATRQRRRRRPALKVVAQAARKDVQRKFTQGSLPTGRAVLPLRGRKVFISHAHNDKRHECPA